MAARLRAARQPGDLSGSRYARGAGEGCIVDGPKVVYSQMDIQKLPKLTQGA